MKSTHLALLAVVVAGGGFAAWWFLIRNKQPKPTQPVGAPTYTPPAALPPKSVAAASPPPAPKQQSLKNTLQAKASSVAQSIANKGLSLATQKATDFLSSLF